MGKVRNSGQSCIAPNRIFIEEIIYDKFIEILIPKISNIKVSDGIDNQTIIGPLINRNAINKILKLIDYAKNKGAKVVYGGKSSNNFLEPTIIIDCNDNMEIFKTEIFGPVIACYKFNNIEEVIKRANNTEYGLQSYIYSNNTQLINTLTTKLDFGMISVNDPIPSNVKAPFAGRKASGFGVEGSNTGIFEYLNSKYISFKSTSLNNFPKVW